MPLTIAMKEMEKLTTETELFHCLLYNWSPSDMHVNFFLLSSFSFLLKFVDVGMLWYSLNDSW